MVYQLDARKAKLCRLCATWQTQVHTIPSDHPMPACWGPLERELLDAAVYEAVGQWDEDAPDAETLADEDDDDDMLCDFGDLGGDD